LIDPERRRSDHVSLARLSWSLKNNATTFFPVAAATEVLLRLFFKDHQPTG
jgi:hypothetical protein